MAYCKQKQFINNLFLSSNVKEFKWDKIRKGLSKDILQAIPIKNKRQTI